MGDIKGFLKTERMSAGCRPVCERVNDYFEVGLLPTQKHSKEQASRCMDCGIPFCHWACPLGNYIPEWNDAVFKGQWHRAFQLLQETNNFPEITGRICPALCEYSCVLGINTEPVTIRENELAIIEHAFKKGMVESSVAKRHTGKSVAIVGSGPAGLACADQLNKAGHKVVVFEQADKVGGILRYGIPDFKLDKSVLERRINLLKDSGIEFLTGIEVGADKPFSEIKNEFDAVCLAGGSREPRDLCIEGRELKGIYFAMDYLTQSNKRVAGAVSNAGTFIDARGKKVVVIGGGDTGADCVGVAHRQQARCVIQIELLPKPPACRSSEFPWPRYPALLKISSSHEEGGKRVWAVLTKRFIGENGRVKKISCVRVEFKKGANNCPAMAEIPGSEFEIEADLVILALGFLHPVKKGLIEQSGLVLDKRGNISAGDSYMTSIKGVFSCGDMHRGQSLIVWAIAEGRAAAHNIDKYLT